MISGELPETAEEKVNLKDPHVILTKYDGYTMLKVVIGSHSLRSLVSPILTPQGIRFATKGGISDVSLIMEQRFLSETKIRYADFAKYCLDRNESPVRFRYTN